MSYETREKLVGVAAYIALVAFCVWFVVYVAAPFLSELADQIVRRLP